MANKNPAYESYRAAKRRCEKPTHDAYPHYGARYGFCIGAFFISSLTLVLAHRAQALIVSTSTVTTSRETANGPRGKSKPRTNASPMESEDDMTTDGKRNEKTRRGDEPRRANLQRGARSLWGRLSTCETRVGLATGIPRTRSSNLFASALLPGQPAVNGYRSDTKPKIATAALFA
jgi:hypothetical protein